MSASPPANPNYNLRWSQFSLRTLFIIVTLFAIVCSFCVVISTPSRRRTHDPEIDAEAAGRTAIAEYDKNGNGKIEGIEFSGVPSLKACMQKIDRNCDGAISAGEITSCIEEWQYHRLGGIRLTCIVTHKKQPLADAEVIFEPEEFLGTWKPLPASGHTNIDGKAQMGTENPDLPNCVYSGFYRIKITNTAEKISAKYNTNTILGLGVYWSEPDIPHEIRFDLE